MIRFLAVTALAAIAAGCASKEPRPLSPEPKSARSEYIFPGDCRFLTPSERYREPACSGYYDPPPRRGSRGPVVQVPEAPLGGGVPTPVPGGLRR